MTEPSAKAPSSLFNRQASAATKQFAVEVCQHNEPARNTLDQVACEVPVALEYNGISHVVMLASPQQLDDFALGFSLSEGILQKADELLELQVHEDKRGYTVAMQISQRRLSELKQRRRNLAGRTGCGLCGTESLEQALRPLPKVNSLDVSTAAIQRALRSLSEHQPLQKETGASHGAAWCDSDGTIQLIREDLGRHNALDKLIGAMCSNPVSSPGFVLISSRASVEMVQKCCTAGLGALVAVSAPTALAVESAQAAGLFLAGFARPGRYVIYNQPHKEEQS